MLVRLLADGAFHSGDELGATLGVGRAGVWKQVRKLAELGIDVHAVRGKGYRIPGGLDLLDEAVIRSRLPAAAVAHIAQLDVFESVDSTNTVAASRARAGGGSYVCLAERQTAGRGRRGRSWVSPYGSNLYLSLLWEFVGGVAVVEGLSVAVGVALAEALHGMGLPGVRLKWPNDLVIGEEKLGGILIELSGDFGGSCRAVIGVGLNVRMPAGATIDQAWTDVARAGLPGVGRNELAAALLGSLLPALRLFEREGLAPFLPRWAWCDALQGREVRLLQADGEGVTGVADGIEPSGALRLQTAGGLVVVRGGEVSVRPA